MLSGLKSVWCIYQIFVFIDRLKNKKISSLFLFIAGVVLLWAYNARVGLQRLESSKEKNLYWERLKAGRINLSDLARNNGESRALWWKADGPFFQKGPGGSYHCTFSFLLLQFLRRVLAPDPSTGFMFRWRPYL